MSGAAATKLLADVALDLDLVLGASQEILVGKRDSDDNSPSEIVIVSENGKERVPTWPHDPNAGPGRRIADIYLKGRRGRSPRADFLWYQSEFKSALELLRDQNRPVQAWSQRLLGRSEELLTGLLGWTDWPGDMRTVETRQEASFWPAHCLLALNEAVKERNLFLAQRWAAELYSAAFALNDLHRWLDFLLDNHLRSLAFQARCEGLFADCDGLFPDGYNGPSDDGGFPSGYLALCWVSNYLEVERQAERLFSISQEYLQATRQEAPLLRDALWIPPNLRGTFLQLRDRLSPANRATWVQASRSPYERSYLTNMLFRMSRTKAVDRLEAVLQRFDKAHPRATVAELMDVIFYRGGDGYAGFEWADRLDPRLMETAAALPDDNERALLGARRAVFGTFGGWTNYGGGVLTLREALDQRKLDCVRATDMIGSLYRDAGRGGFFNVRWLCGTVGHTVAAAEIRSGDKVEMVVADGLDASPAGRAVWSPEYFRGHAWPTGYPDKPRPVYAMELSARGLDSYVWVEGCILQGPDAGLHVRPPVPYLPGREKEEIIPPSGSSAATAPR